uniref:Uncharacterized protein n=1 Tax=viral metagenome TaxID=1070528 RepID=A0A6H1ZQ75_9ZZZZ
MATTLKQARDQLAGDAGVKGHKDFPAALLNRYLNIAQKYVQKTLNGLGMKKWEQAYDCTANLAAGKYNGVSVKIVTMAQIKTGSTYDVSIMPNGIRNIEVGDGVSLAASTNFGITTPADEKNFHKILADSYLSPVITEPRHLWQDNQIVLAPSTITAAKVHFYRVVADLSSDSAEFEVPDEFISFVIKNAEISVKNKLGILADKDEAIAELDKAIKDEFNAFMSQVNMENNDLKQII